MIEKDFNNEFKFSLYQGDVLICENMFDADQFNPFTRYTINIRDILRRSISKLQKTLSKKYYITELSGGFDLYQHQLKLINKYPYAYRQDMRYNPQSIVQQIEDKVIKGVECKIGFYINDKPIVERVFYVDGFNPVSRWSMDVLYAVTEITDSIFDDIKKNDIRNMWDDYDMINELGVTINQIREFSIQQREDMLRRIRK